MLLLHFASAIRCLCYSMFPKVLRPPCSSFSLIRVQPGHCFHLFTRHQLEKMADFQEPEMVRTPLEELALQIKVLKLGMVEPFLARSIEPPPDLAVTNALNTLKNLVSWIWWVGPRGCRGQVGALGYYVREYKICQKILNGNQKVNVFPRILLSF